MCHHEHDTAVSCEISQSQKVSCRLNWYPPRYSQPPHLHSRAQVSLLLAGSLCETALGSQRYPTHYSLAAKPSGAEHAVHFGINGALILSFDLSPDDVAASDRSPMGWVWCDAERTRLIVATCVPPLSEVPNMPAECVEDVAWDLLTAVPDSAPAPYRPPPPRWLHHIKEALDEAPRTVRVGEAAYEAGVHRTHLARLFRRHYGTSVSVYRRRALVAAAVQCVAQGTSLAYAANAAGFADQSHMTRVLKAEVGARPSTLRKLLALSPVTR